MSAMASQITSLTIVYSNVYSGEDQRNLQSSASLAFAGNSPETGEFPAQRISNAENVSNWCDSALRLEISTIYIFPAEVRFRVIMSSDGDML